MKKTVGNPNTIDVKKYCFHRHRYPFEVESSGIGLDFNFWVGNHYLSNENLVDLLESCIFGKRSLALRGSVQPSSIVCLYVEDLDPADFTEKSEELSFLASSTSVPIASAKIDTLKESTNNPNPWFWNDVKRLPSLLLWPHYGPTLFQQSGSIPSRDLFQNFQVHFKCVHDTNYDIIVLSPEKYEGESLEVVKECTRMAFDRKFKNVPNPFADLFEDESKLLYGVFHLPRTNMPGFYVCEVSEKLTRLFFIWQTGDVDILVYSGDMVDSQATFSTEKISIDVDDGNVSVTDQMVASILQIRPFLWATVPTAPPSDEVPEGGESQKIPDSATAPIVPMAPEAPSINQALLENIQRQFKETPNMKEIIQEFVLSRDILDIMGFVLNNDMIQFLHTSYSFHWDKSITLPVQDEKDDSAQSHIRFDDTAMEEGEEEEEDGEEKETVPTSSFSLEKYLPMKADYLAFQRLSSQAFTIFNLEQLIQSARHSSDKVFPLNYCAIDCEMCSTREGLELTRITIIDPFHGIILDSLVKPKLEIIDYHTEFSGVTQQSLDKITVTLEDIQIFLRYIINKDTIIIGHSLDTDLKALRVVHYNVIDTAALFPHHSGLPFKYSLKKLMKDYLNRDIQDSSAGHDSAQDAIAALELLLFQVSLRRNSNQKEPANYESLLQELRNEGQQLAETENTQKRLKFTFFDYLFFKNQRFHCSSAPSAFSLEIFSAPIFKDFPFWERNAFGYKRNDDLVSVLETFLSQREKIPEFVDLQLDTKTKSCGDWKSVIASIQESLQSPKNDTTMKLIFGEMSLFSAKQTTTSSSSSSSSSSTTVPSAEDDQPNKKQRLNNSDEETPSSSSPLSPLQEFNAQLEDLFSSLPKDTLLLIFSQKCLKESKKLIARKIRYKWDNTPIPQPAPPAGSKDKPKVVKRSRVPLPLRNGFSNNKKAIIAGYEWDPSTDENRLIEETNNCATCSLFMRYKRE